MSQFFSSTLIILLGGFLSLVFARQKKFSKGIAVLFLSAGSLLGLIDAAGKLLNPAGGPRPLSGIWISFFFPFMLTAYPPFS